MPVRGLFAALLIFVAAPALAAPKCETELARLEGPDKRVFVVDGYGEGGYFENTDRGRVAYYVHAWRGTENGINAHPHLHRDPGHVRAELGLAQRSEGDQGEVRVAQA